MKNRGKNIGLLLTGMAVGAALCGGAYAAGIVAQPTWQPIYVDGQQVEMEAYNINGNNYVKLRDIGKEVGFNVYWQDGVQVDSDADYTGEPPSAPGISSVKGTTLAPGERSGLIISGGGAGCVVTSSNPKVASVEKVSGSWVVEAHAEGTATLTAKDAGGGACTVTITVAGDDSGPADQTTAEVDLTANADIRQKMVDLINQVRLENGAAALTISDPLMDAAQDCASQCFTSHNNQYEGEAATNYGYEHGFGSNLTWFTARGDTDIAQTAVTNWVNSSGHFQTMVSTKYDCVGVGVCIRNNIAYCYMFSGNPNSVNAYG